VIEVLIVTTIAFAAVPVYVFVIYPVLLWLLARVAGLGAPASSTALPAVTMVVSCYNEEAVLPQKIHNCLEIDYPAERLDFVFVSDASTDGTDAIILKAGDSRIRLVRQSERLGKTCGLNLAMTSIDSDVVVFSDANAMYQADAVRHLVAPFGDESVGYVVGAALYEESGNGASGRAETLYWDYEIWLKRQESALHSVVGGDGAIYAIRRELFWPFDAQDINDLVNPLQIVKAGYRGVFERRAICIEHPAEDFDKESRRKRRIVNRSFTAVLKHRSLLNPLRNARFAFALWSHKLLRWLLAPFLVVALAGLLLLGLVGGPVFAVTLVPVLASLWLATAGFLLKDRSSQPMFTAVPYYFFMVAASATLGLLDSLKGRVAVTWEPPRARTSAVRRESAVRGSAWLTLSLLGIAIVWSLFRLPGVLR